MKNIDKTLSPAWSRPLPRLAPPPSAAFARRLGDGLLPWLLPLGLALLWWVASHRHWMSAQVLPTPELVWQSARELLAGELWSELAISLRRLAWGLLAGVASGAALGAWLGFSPRAERLVFPTFSALAQIPTLAWIPLFMLFFGIGELLKLVVLVKAVVVPVTIHTLIGVRDAQPKLREAAAVLRLPPRLLVWRLILPAALPAFLTGLRLALAQGWTSLLAVELLASSEGIGYLMVQGRQLFMDGEPGNVVAAYAIARLKGGLPQVVVLEAARGCELEEPTPAGHRWREEFTCAERLAVREHQLVAREERIPHVVVVLRDGGAGHFVACIQAVRARTPSTRIEILVPDFRGRDDRALEILKAAPPDVMNHNLETIPRLYKEARPGSDYAFSLNLLKKFKALFPDVPTKSGLMVGLGETDEEILQVMRDMRAHDIDMLTIGQYLAPSGHHLPVRRYVHPDTFRMFEAEAQKMGFTHAAVGAMVRSSYHADQQASQAGVSDAV